MDKSPPSTNIFANYQLKTTASINHTHSDNFYIGSKDSHILRKRKTVNITNKTNK